MLALPKSLESVAMTGECSNRLIAASKPEQLEIEKLRREVAKLKAERDILEEFSAYFAKDSM
jgi:transposase-like protein